MATALPAKLKTADISRFALRATQLEKIKPVISYWCEYYILQQILGKELHKQDKECENYAVTLMEKLEETKSQHADNDAVTDDVAAQAYIEQFATETFQRADNAVRANKVSAQTADTFRAAATFLDMLGIWQQPLDAEVSSKSKYAKYHALRIARALKAGEDPNLSNPKPDPESSEALPMSPPALDPNDPEVQRINNPGLYQPPTVESVPQSMPTSPPFSSSQPAYQSGPLPPHDISPISPPDETPAQASSVGVPPSPGGGYFPRVPTFTSETSASTLPTAPPDEFMPDRSPALTPQNLQPPQQPPSQPPFPISPIQPDVSPAAYYQQQQQPPFQQPSAPPPAPAPSQHFSPPAFSHYPPAPQPQAPQAPQAPSAPTYSTFESPRPARVRYQPDDDAVIKAQKHARFAISALHFEDVDTAVKYLQDALRELTGS